MSILNFFRNRNHSSNDRYILCIDGGGMRGIVPIMILKKVEQILREKGEEKALQSYFDLIAGTSTGGLIASSLSFPEQLDNKECKDAKQVNLDSLENIYMTVGKTIFPTGGAILSIVNAPHQVVANKYSADGIENLLQKWFGETKLNEAKVPTMIMAYNLSEGSEKILRSYENCDITVAQACRATSAAPTYFAPIMYENQLLADGGVVANNPSLYAYLEAKKLYPNCRMFHILSIGTAGEVHRTNEDETSGLLNWIDQISPMYITAQKKTVDNTLKNLEDVDYLRIDCELDQPMKMDDVREKSMQKLKDFGSKIAQDSEPNLRKYFAKLLKSKDM